MPQTSYMRIDGRHDHSIRIPRPDLSIKINTPNACNQCHKDKTPLWAQQNMLNWYGKDWDHGWHFGETLNDARNHAPGAGVDVATVAASPELSSITRATATEMLQNFPSPTSFLVIKKSLADKNELIRLSALRTLDNIDVQYRQQLATPLLSDPIRAIRIEAARILAAVPRYMFTRQQQLILDEAISEYIQAQLVNAERPESHLNIGLIRLSLQQYEEAEDAYQQAIKLAPEFIATYVNLADLYRLQQKDEKAEKILTQALQISPEAADTHHALGLLYVRKKQMHKALLSLSRAANYSRKIYATATSMPLHLIVMAKPAKQLLY